MVTGSKRDEMTLDLNLEGKDLELEGQTLPVEKSLFSWLPFLQDGKGEERGNISCFCYGQIEDKN